MLLKGIHKHFNDCLDEQMLMNFVAHCDKNLHLSYSTIKLYLSGIRFFLLKNERTQSYRKHFRSTFTMFTNNFKWCQEKKC